MKLQILSLSLLLSHSFCESVMAVPCKCIGGYTGNQMKNCEEPKHYTCGSDCDCKYGRVCGSGGYCVDGNTVNCIIEGRTGEQMPVCKEADPCQSNSDCMRGRHCSWPPTNPGYCVPGQGPA